MSQSQDPTNPYAVTIESASDDAVTPTTKFRWRIIPTTLCFIFGGIMLLVLPVAMFQIFLVIWHGEVSTAREFLAEAMAASSFFAISGASTVAAGVCWLKGRWLLYALLLNAVGYAVSFAPAFVQAMFA